MTELKKRFQKLVPEHFGGMQQDLMASCEKIADEHAIAFLESIMDYERENGERICFDERSAKELLKIFKTKK